MLHLIYLQSGSNAPLVRCFFVRTVADTVLTEHIPSLYEKTNNTICARFGAYAIFGNKWLAVSDIQY